MKVSVIIPVYNAAAMLPRCLESLAAQTYRDFEVICVDDGSTDGGVEAVEKQARPWGLGGMRILRQENAGTLVARKRGVEAAQGEYICFVDPDDAVKPQFLERLICVAERGNWDIVQCGVELEETRERTERQKAVSERYFNPDAPTVRHGGLLTRAYLHKRIGWNLIFRLFRASLVKEAFAALPEVKMINDTDAAAFFGIAARARRFKRIRDRLYVYRYGEGISTRITYSLEDYRRTLGKFDFLRDFAAQIKGFEAEAAFVVMAQRMCEVSRKSAYARLPEGESRAEALRALQAKFASEPRPLHHIGIHYFNVHIGGVQRVMLQEIEVFKSLGVEVTLFLEDEPEPTDFKIPKGIEVKQFPRSLGHVLPEEERIPLVAALLRESGIDCWYDQAIFAPCFVQNVCIAKWLLGLPVLTHYHTTFSAPLRFRLHPEYYDLQAHAMRLADLSFVLGAVDAAYFARERVRVAVLPNALSEPCQLALQKPVHEKSSRTVLWCARDGWEKHMEDARRIAARVSARLSDVPFKLVSGVSDPTPFFEQASVFLMTSEVEGFPMTALEALAHGLPIVSYQLDNLDLFQGNPAVFQVPQHDCAAAAEAIVSLLNRADLPDLRAEARASLKPFAAFNHRAFWARIIGGDWKTDLYQSCPEDSWRMFRLEVEARLYRAEHPVCQNRDRLSWRLLHRYIRDNGLKYTFQKALSSVWRHI